MNDNILHKIALSMIKGIGPAYAKRLIDSTGSIESIFNETKKNLLKIPAINFQIVDLIKNKHLLEDAKKEIEFINLHNIKPISYFDDNYPQRLRHCGDAPLIIYTKGNTNFNTEKVISIVGTRKATQYGKDICNNLIKELKENKHFPTIVSGLAYGIDIAAHKAALNNGLNTIAALGHSLDKVYPAAHKRYAQDIINQGALISEFNSNSIALPTNFLKRNRIIAGMSDATIIVESSRKGGALVTADIANSYNRDVFAYPGKVGDTYSEGCNKLIKSNKAALIENVKDLEYILGWNVTDDKKYIQRELFTNLSKEEEKIVDIIKESNDIYIDTLSIKAKMPVHKVSSILLNLEFSGIIKTLPGKIYSLNK